MGAHVRYVGRAFRNIYADGFIHPGILEKVTAAAKHIQEIK